MTRFLRASVVATSLIFVQGQAASSPADPFPTSAQVVLDQALAHRDIVDQRRDDAYSDEDADAATRRADEHIFTVRRELSIDIADDGTSRWVERHVYVLNTLDATRRLGTVEVPWWSWREDRPELFARVIGLDGRVSVLDPSTIIVASARGDDPLILSDEQRLRAPLPNVQPGSVIETIRRRTLRPGLDGTGPGAVYPLSERHSVGHHRVVIEGPSSKAFKVDLLGDVPATLTRERVRGGRVRYQVALDDLAPLIPRDSPTPLDPPRPPSIAFSYGAGWEELADIYHRATAPLVSADGLDAWIAALGPQPLTRRAAVERAMTLLREQNRYTGVELGQNAILPYRPAETVARGYGDCKDRSSVVVALLRSVGIPAHLALIRAGREQDTSPDHPSLDVFDHAIVYLPAHDGEAETWLDATVEWYPYGSYPAGLAGRHALVIGATGPALRRVGVPEASSNAEVRVTELDLRAPGPALRTFEIQPRGVRAGELRSMYDVQGAARAREYARSMRPDTATLDFRDPKDMTRPFSATYTRTQRAVRPERIVTFNATPPVSEVLDALPRWIVRAPSVHDPFDAMGAGQRTAFAPMRFESRHVVRFPESWHVVTSDPIDETFGPVQITVSGQAIGPGTFQTVAVLDPGDGRLTADDVLAIRDFVGDGGLGRYRVVVGHAGAMHSRFERPMDAWPAFLAAPPEAGFEPGYEMAAVRFLLANGFDIAAIDRLRSAEIDDPWFRLERFDVLNRRRPRGPTTRAVGSPAGAPERRALVAELMASDPEDTLGLVDWHRSQLIDAWRFGPRSERAALADVLLAFEVRDEPRVRRRDKRVLAMLAADVHGSRGEPAAGLRRLREEFKSGPPSRMMLALIAAADGPDALRTRAASLSRGTPPNMRDRAFNRPLFSAIEQLLAWREFDLARRVAELLRDDPTESSERRQLRALIADAQRAEPDWKRVAAPLRPIFLALDPLVRDGKPLSAVHATEEAIANGAALRTALLQAGAPLQGVHDLVELEMIAGGATVSATAGRDRATRLMVDIAGKPLAVYLIRDRGRTRLVSIGQPGVPVIAEAWRAHERGDHATARQWAVFLREASEAGGPGSDPLAAVLLPDGADDATIGRGLLILAARSWRLDLFDRAAASLPALTRDQRDAAFPALWRATPLQDVESWTHVFIPEAEASLVRLHELALGTEMNALNASDARRFLAAWYLSAGRFDDAGRLLEAPLPDPAMASKAEVLRARWLIATGRPDEARARLEPLWAALEGSPDLGNVAWVWMLAGGAPERARDALRRVVQVQRRPNANTIARVQALALAYALCGELDRSAEALRASSEVIRAEKWARQGFAIVRFAVALRWGDPDLAAAALAEAHPLAPWEIALWEQRVRAAVGRP